MTSDFGDSKMAMYTKLPKSQSRRSAIPIKPDLLNVELKNPFYNMLLMHEIDGSLHSRERASDRELFARRVSGYMATQQVQDAKVGIGRKPYLVLLLCRDGMSHIHSSLKTQRPCAVHASTNLWARSSLKVHRR